MKFLQASIYQSVHKDSKYRVFKIISSDKYCKIHNVNAQQLLKGIPSTKAQVILFCSTSLPLAITRWVCSTLLSHCPLF